MRASVPRVVCVFVNDGTARCKAEQALVFTLLANGHQTRRFHVHAIIVCGRGDDNDATKWPMLAQRNVLHQEHGDGSCVARVLCPLVRDRVRDAPPLHIITNHNDALRWCLEAASDDDDQRGRVHMWHHAPVMRGDHVSKDVMFVHNDPRLASARRAQRVNTYGCDDVTVLTAADITLLLDDDNAQQPSGDASGDAAHGSSIVSIFCDIVLRDLRERTRAANDSDCEEEEDKRTWMTHLDPSTEVLRCEGSVAAIMRLIYDEQTVAFAPVRNSLCVDTLRQQLVDVRAKCSQRSSSPSTPPLPTSPRPPQRRPPPLVVDEYQFPDAALATSTNPLRKPLIDARNL